MDKINQENAGNSPMTFPCEFVVKVFGAATDEFKTAVKDIIRKHYPNLNDSDITCRPSKDGKYHALSIAMTADSREQLDAIYQELTSNPMVLMAL